VGNPLNPIYDAVAWVLKQIYGFLSPIFGQSSGWTWALSIVILVVLMRLIMVPLFVKQMHTTRAMSALAPQMQALRKKYKNDKQTLQQETMKLYQQAGVNPLMGCLPVALQLPMFFALFSVLKAIAEWKPGETPKYGLTHTMVASAQKAKILGATVADKFLFTDGVHVPLQAKAVILVAVLISMTTTYLTVRQSMKRGMMPAATPDNPMGQSQKYMMYIMPFFALSGLYWPFGLVLYWVTTNCWTLLQQYVLFRRFPQAQAAGAAGAAGAVTSPAVAPVVTTRPKRAVTGQAKPGSTGQSKPGSTGQAKPGSTGQAKPGSTGQAKPTSSGSPAAQNVKKPSEDAAVKRAGGGAAAQSNGAAKPGPASRKAAAAPGAAKATGNSGSARQGAAPSANGTGTGGGTGGGAGSVLRRLGKRAEPEPQPSAPEVKLVRQQRQRQSRSKRSGKR
jgi:YidC/Oxa1 family membrane protein insertase